MDFILVWNGNVRGRGICISSNGSLSHLHKIPHFYGKILHASCVYYYFLADGQQSRVNLIPCDMSRIWICDWCQGASQGVISGVGAPSLAYIQLKIVYSQADCRSQDLWYQKIQYLCANCNAHPLSFWSHPLLFAPSLLCLTVVYYATSLNKSISSMIITKIVHVTVLDVALLCCHVQTRSSQTGWWRRDLVPEGWMF